MLVLALHAMACVAGFIAGSSLPLQAEHRPASRAGCTSTADGWRSRSSRCATTFSLSAQAYVIGHSLAGVSHFLRVSPGLLLLGVLPARDPRADGAVPPAGGVDHREPPRGVGPAARGDGRDGCDRGADARRRGLIEVYVSPHLFTALTRIHPPIVRESGGFIVVVR